MTILLQMNLGFAWGTADTTVPGPYLVVGRGIYVPGASDRNVFTPGAMTAERQGIFTPGAADKEVRS